MSFLLLMIAQLTLTMSFFEFHSKLPDTCKSLNSKTMKEAQEFQEVLKQLNNGNVQGKGGFGEVKKIELNNQKVAVKKISKSDSAKTYVTEVNAMNSLKGVEGINKIISCYSTDKEVYIVQPLYHSDLDKTATKDRFKNLPLEQFIYIVIAALKTLIVMHKNGIIHRDLKPNNIMVTNNTSTEWIFIDFGVSVKKSEVCFAGTPGFISPRMINNKSSHQAEENDDLWSFIVTILIVLIDQRIFVNFRSVGNKIHSCVFNKMTDPCLTTFINNINSAKSVRSTDTDAFKIFIDICVEYLKKIYSSRSSSSLVSSFSDSLSKIYPDLNKKKIDKESPPVLATKQNKMNEVRGIERFDARREGGSRVRRNSVDNIAVNKNVLFPKLVKDDSAPEKAKKDNTPENVDQLNLNRLRITSGDIAYEDNGEINDEKTQVILQKKILQKKMPNIPLPKPYQPKRIFY